MRILKRPIFVKKLEHSNYEMICFFMRQKPQKNKVLAILDYLQKRYIFLKIFQSYEYIETDYLIISANPIFSNIVSQILKEKKIKSVFINNVYEEDAFPYHKVNPKFLGELLEGFNIKLTNPTPSIFFNNTTNEDFICNNSKEVALSYSGKKYENRYVFSYVLHKPYDKKELNKEKSLYYKKIWDFFIHSTIGHKNIWNNKVELEKVKSRVSSYVLAKKIIILMDNSQYIEKSLTGDENILAIDYGNQNFNIELIKFIESNK